MTTYEECYYKTYAHSKSKCQECNRTYCRTMQKQKYNEVSVLFEREKL